MYLSMSSGSVTYLSLLINPSARIFSSEILFRRRGAFFGFVLLASSFKNLATILRIISSAETSVSAGLLSFFSLKLSLPSWREVLPPVASTPLSSVPHHGPHDERLVQHAAAHVRDANNVIVLLGRLPVTRTTAPPRSQ
jgi:hypothetical protein